MSQARINWTCTIKSRRFLPLAPAHLGSHGKRAVKQLCVCVVRRLLKLVTFDLCNNRNGTVYWTAVTTVHTSTRQWHYQWAAGVLTLAVSSCSSCCQVLGLVAISRRVNHAYGTLNLSFLIIIIIIIIIMRHWWCQEGHSAIVECSCESPTSRGAHPGQQMGEGVHYLKDDMQWFFGCQSKLLVVCL